MRFLMLNWRDPKNPLSGGAERVTLAFMKALVQKGHEVYWYANSFPGCLNEEVIEGIHFVRGGGTGSSIIKAIKWYRSQNHFDLVIDQHHGIPWFAPWWCGTNCVSYIHEVLGPIWDSFYSWPLSSIGRCQERWTHWFYRNNIFFTPSTYTRDTLIEHGVKSVEIMPNGVYTRALQTLPEKKLESPLRLIVVSRLAPNKRIDQAIRTVFSLKQMGVQASLRIIGKGESEQSLESLVTELKLEDQVVFLGGLSENDKDAELQNAHYLVHTSVREGWGLNVIEANAMGTPGAVYPVPGLVESTIHDETGVISKKETPESLAEVLAACYANPFRYEYYRENALKRADDSHWDKVLPSAIQWFEDHASVVANGKT